MALDLELAQGAGGVEGLELLVISLVFLSLCKVEIRELRQVPIA